jgi:hypothetical protein
LTPDTKEYAHGQAAWSSLFGAAAGYLYGGIGIQALGIFGATLLGVMLGYSSNHSWTPGLLFVSPPGWYTVQASVDALGAAVAIIAYRQGHNRRERLSYLPVVASAHSVAALGFLLVTLAHDRRRIRLATAFFAGGVACALMVHFQVRYFLTPLSLLV